MRTNFYLNKGLIFIDKKVEKNFVIYRIASSLQDFIFLKLTKEESVIMDELLIEKNPEIQKFKIIKNRNFF